MIRMPIREYEVNGAEETAPRFFSWEPDKDHLRRARKVYGKHTLEMVAKEGMYPVDIHYIVFGSRKFSLDNTWIGNKEAETELKRLYPDGFS